MESITDKNGAVLTVGSKIRSIQTPENIDFTAVCIEISGNIAYFQYKNRADTFRLDKKNFYNSYWRIVG